MATEINHERQNTVGDHVLCSPRGLRYEIPIGLPGFITAISEHQVEIQSANSLSAFSFLTAVPTNAYSMFDKKIKVLRIVCFFFHS